MSKFNAIIMLQGEPHPHVSEFNRADVVIRALNDGSLEVIKSVYPEIPLGTFVQGDVVKICDTHGELFHEVPGIMRGCYAGNDFLPCSGEWIERGQA